MPGMGQPASDVLVFGLTQILTTGQIMHENAAKLGLPREKVFAIGASNHLTICKFNRADGARLRNLQRAIRDACLTTIPRAAQRQTTRREKSRFGETITAALGMEHF